MPVETNVLVALVVGLVFGFLIGILVGLSGRDKKKKKGADQKKALPAAAAEFLEKEPYEFFDVHVARVDVERGAVIGVEHHVDDLIEELKEEGELRHLLRLVVLGYDEEGEKLATIPELCDHFLKIHGDQPYFSVLLDRNSMKIYLKILLRAKKRAGEIPPGADETAAIDQLHQEVVGHVTQLLTSLFAGEQEKLSQLLDQLLGRLEKICEQMEKEEEQRRAALQEGAGQ